MIDKDVSLREYIDKSKLLLLPLIVKKVDDLRKWTMLNLKGVFYQDRKNPQWGNKIILVYENRIEETQSLQNWESSEYRYDSYKEFINGKVYSVFAYNVPTKFEKDFEKMIHGDYSKISRQTSNHVLDVHFKANNGKLLTNYNKVKKILYPPITETLNSKREYVGAFAEKEILDINLLNSQYFD